MARPQTDPKAKEKRQKLILVVGSVLLLGLLAFQLPKTLKMLKGTPAATESTTTTPGAGAGGSTTTTTGAALTTAPVSGLRESDPRVAPSVDKLVTFSRFSLIDPFKQQVNPDAGPGETAATAQPTASNPAQPVPSTPAATPVFGTVETGAKPAKAQGEAPASLPTATVRVNGKPVQVPLGEEFPKGDSVFRLAGFGPGTVQVVVVGGSLVDGSTTLTLKRKHAVTLVNTVDGARYKLELLSMATAS